MGIPPEDPGVAPEYQTPPDEFNRFAPHTEETEQKPSRLRKVMLFFAAAGLIALGFFTPKRGVLPPADAQATAAPSLAPGETPGPTAETATALPTGQATGEPTPEPSDTPSPAPTDTPGPTEVPYPLRSEGTIHVVVCADMMDENYTEVILAEETFDEATFDHYDLPALPTQTGYEAQGYVIQSMTDWDYFGFEKGLHSDNPPDRIVCVPLRDSVLTARDLGIVPVGADGVREVEVHVMWTGAGQQNFPLHLDDGQTVTEYRVGFPIWSEGLVYLDAFPIPEQDGKTFSGWFDADGNRVWAVTYFDFYTATPGSNDIEDRDWSAPVPFTLYAHWE